MIRNVKSDRSAPRRVGAVRAADIPPDVMDALNAGRAEALTLAEWLAVDRVRLLEGVLPEVGAADLLPELREAIAGLADEGTMARMRGIGAELGRLLRERPDGERIEEALAIHPSDVVRALAAYAAVADPGMDLTERLEAARRFAADSNMSVRECAWESVRPGLAGELERGIALLEPWVRDLDPNVRRCAVEATRPRGVWTRHIDALKRDPEPGLRLLEPVRSDPSRYVQTSVANWLNDASKSRPDWVRGVCARWELESPTPQTYWIVRHALRTLRKAEGDG